jgi:chaperonin cofactor prefoldin
MFANISNLSHYISSVASNTTEKKTIENHIQDLYSVTEELKCVYGYTYKYMSGKGEFQSIS